MLRDNATSSSTVAGNLCSTNCWAARLRPAWLWSPVRPQHRTAPPVGCEVDVVQPVKILCNHVVTRRYYARAGGLKFGIEVPSVSS